MAAKQYIKLGFYSGLEDFYQFKTPINTKNMTVKNSGWKKSQEK
jgi:hypothetical protein